MSASSPLAAAAGPADAPASEVRGLGALRRGLGWSPRSALVLAAVCVLSALTALLQGAVLRLAPGAWHVLPRTLSRIVTWLVGVRVARFGTPAAGPVLFVANHISWIDIPVLSAGTGAAFIAKKEIEGWSGMGVMARRYRSVFVDRTRRHASAAQRDEILERLRAGDSLVLFAEGTSTDGTAIAPFKSALFAVAQALPDLKVQPVSIVYTHINGIPVTRARRPLLGWYGDMELTGHVWRALALGRIRAEIHFHRPLTMREAGSRKALAERCRNAVARGLEAARSGRSTAISGPSAGAPS